MEQKKILKLANVAASMFFSGYYLTGIATNYAGMIGAAIMTIVFETSKIEIFKLVSSQYKNSSLSQKVTLSAICSFMVAFSLLASFCSISEMFKEKKHQTFLISGNAAFLKDTKQKLELEIEAMLEAQKFDYENKYIARADKRSSKIQELRLELETTNKKILERAKDPEPKTSSLIETNTIHIVSIIACSLVMEVCYILHFFIKEVMHITIKTNNLASNTANKDKDKKNKTPKTNTTLNELANKILTGEINPTQRELKKRLKVGTNKINQIMQELLMLGIIERNGRGFVATKNINQEVRLAAC